MSKVKDKKSLQRVLKKDPRGKKPLSGEMEAQIRVIRNDIIKLQKDLASGYALARQWLVTKGIK